MVINDLTIRRFLAIYGINDPVLEKETLVDIDRPYQQTRAVKLYLRLTLPSRTVVLKVLRLPMCSDRALEDQSRFAERFRSGGLPTVESFPVTEAGLDTGYAASVQVGDLDCQVKLEDDAGVPLSEPDESLAPVLGHLLGKMHAIAEKAKFSAGPGAFYTEFSRRNTDYDPLWAQCGTDFLSEDCLNRIRRLYTACRNEVQSVFKQLPCYAVQGDLYYMNLVKKGPEYRVIDYDRLGDEVLLTDLVLTWHRFWFDPCIFGPVEGQTVERRQREHILWEQFFSAYREQRMLTEAEYRHLPYVYSLLGAVYGTRLLAGMASSGHKQTAACLLPDIEDILTHARI